MTTLVLDRSGFQRFIRRIPPVYVFLILVFAGGAILDFVGKELTLKTRMVQRVIKKPVT